MKRRRWIEVQSPRSSIARALLAILLGTGLLVLAAPAPARDEECTITGTAGTDFLEGTEEDDVLCGLPAATS